MLTPADPSALSGLLTRENASKSNCYYSCSFSVVIVVVVVVAVGAIVAATSLMPWSLACFPLCFTTALRTWLAWRSGVGVPGHIICPITDSLYK